MLKKLSLGLITAALVSAAWMPVGSRELGNITFPTSGAPAAQAAFLEGVKSLHSFQFDEAAVAFQRAQKTDPAFAMAYCGEAMSHNRPLWAQQDAEAAKKVLELSLQRTPNRTASLKVLARARSGGTALR